MTAVNDNTLAADILRGADAIGAFLGFPRRSIYHLAATGGMPYFRIGDIICARRSTLIAWIAAQEEAIANSNHQPAKAA